MEKLLFLFSCSLLLTVGYAQQDSTGKKKPVKGIPDARYCAMLNGGKIEITQNGKPLKADLELKNGRKLTATGTLIRKDGTIQMIKPGTCVNAEGNESEQAEGKKYNELGENWQQFEQGRQQGGNPYGGGAGGQQYRYEGDINDLFGNAGESSGHSDFFEQFFGRGSGAGKSQRQKSNVKGNDYESEMEITLEEAYHSTNRIIQLENEKLRISTKPGAYDGQLLRIKGKGGKGSSPEHHGDLFVRVRVKPHHMFTRRGDDLLTTHSIDLYTAVLGGETVVPTLTGKVKVKIEAGTQNGKTIRMKGKGMAVSNKPGSHGDLYVQLNILIPDKLTDKQRELFEQLKTTL